MSGRQDFPPLLRLFWVGSIPAFSWVGLSIPVQVATRRLVRQRASVAVLAHVGVAAAFHISHSILLISMRAAVRLSPPHASMSEEVWRHAVGSMPENLLVYSALVA